MTVELARSYFKLEKDEPIDREKIIAVGKEAREELKRKELSRYKKLLAETKLNACIVLITNKEI